MAIMYITVFVFAFFLVGALTIPQSFGQEYDDATDTYEFGALPFIYDDNYTIERFVTGLEYPTTMDFIGDDILVLEKNTGKVIRVQANGVKYSEPVLDVPVNFQAGSGLLGIGSGSDHIYLYFTESLSGSDVYIGPELFVPFLIDSRNVVYQYDWDGEKLSNPILIEQLVSDSPKHIGGVITKGLNNEIYFAVEDPLKTAKQQVTPERINRDYVGIFKIDADDNNVELFATGIRNSFGLGVDPYTGYLWDTENGPDQFDEINLVKPGFNSGWKVVMGPTDREYFQTSIAQQDLVNELLNAEPIENFVYSEPEFSWDLAVGVTAITFPDKGSFSAYSDSLFVGDYNNGRIYNFQLNSDRTEFVFYNRDLTDLVLDDGDIIDEILFAKDFHGVTDIKFHDGAMYVVAIGDGSIYKIYPKDILSPLKQYQNGVPHNKIFCKPELMPIMSKSGSIYCVQPKTAITLNNALDWSVNHPEMPQIQLRNQDLQGLNFEHLNLSNSDFRKANFDTTKISNANFTRANLSHTNLSSHDLTGTVLRGADLSHSILTGADLSGVDLTGTILIGAYLSNSDLTGVDLSGKDLTGTIFTGVDMSSMDLSSVDLTKMNLSGSKFFHVDLSGVDLSGVDLSGVNLSGMDLSGIDLSGTIFTGRNLSGMNLTGANLIGADLSSVDLSNAILTNTNLENAILTSANLKDANLDGANLINADLGYAIFAVANLSNVVLTGADLTGANLIGANLSNSDLTGVDLTKTILLSADLSNSDLIGADLSGVDLTGTNLVGADLSHSILTGVDLSGVDLTGTNLIGVDLLGMKLSHTILTNANLENAMLENVHIIDATLDSANLTNANLRGALLAYSNLSKAKLTGADLTGVNLTEAVLTNANLENATLKNANLIDANLDGANLINADLENALLADANLSNAVLTGADLTNVVLTGAILTNANLENAILTSTILNCVGHPICV